MISAQARLPLDYLTIEQPDRDVNNWGRIPRDDQEKIAFLCDDYCRRKEEASLCTTQRDTRTLALAEAVKAEGFSSTTKEFIASVKAKMTVDGWTTDGTSNNYYYRLPGDGRSYRSYLEVALGHYPDLIDPDALRRAKERVIRERVIIGAGAEGYTTIGCDHLNQDVLRGDAYGTVVGWFPVGESATGGARYRVRYDDDDSKEDLDEAELATALKAADESPRPASSNAQRFDVSTVGGIRSGRYLDATASGRPHLPGIDHVHDWEDHEMQTFLESMLRALRFGHATLKHVNAFLANFTDVSVAGTGLGRRQCEYEEIGEDGEKHWVRVASRPGAARLKGVSYSSLRNGLKRKDIWTAPNGVRFRNVSDSFWGEGGDNSALVFPRAEAAGSNRQKKVSARDRRTQGAPCEYEEIGEDGEKHWVRARSHCEAARRTGVTRSAISYGLNVKDIYTAPNGVRFREASVIEGEGGEHYPRRAADEMDVEKDLDVADVDRDETLEEEDEGEEEFYDFDESTPEQSECEEDFCGSDVEESTDNELMTDAEDDQTEPRLGLAQGDIVSVASAAFGDAFAASVEQGVRWRGKVEGPALDGCWQVLYDNEDSMVTSGEHITLLWRRADGKRRDETPPPPGSMVEVLFHPEDPENVDERGKLYTGKVFSVCGKYAKIHFDNGDREKYSFPTKLNDPIYITYRAAPVAPSLAMLGPADGVQLQASSNANALEDDGAESVESSRPPSLGPPSPTAMDLEDEEFGPTDDVVSEPPSVGQLPADDFLSVAHMNNLYQDEEVVAEGLDETFTSEPKPKPQAGRAFDLFAGTGEDTANLGRVDASMLESELLALAPAGAKYIREATPAGGALASDLFAELTREESVDLGPLDGFTLQSEPLELAPAFAKYLEDKWVEVYWPFDRKWYAGKITRWRTACGGKHVQLFVEYTDNDKIFHKFCPEPFLGDGEPPYMEDRDPQQWRFANEAEAAKYYELLDHRTGVTF